MILYILIVMAYKVRYDGTEVIACNCILPCSLLAKQCCTGKPPLRCIQ